MNRNNYRIQLLYQLRIMYESNTINNKSNSKMIRMNECILSMLIR